MGFGYVADAYPSAINFWQKSNRTGERGGEYCIQPLGEGLRANNQSIKHKRLPDATRFFNFSCIPIKNCFDVKFHPLKKGGSRPPKLFPKCPTGNIDVPEIHAATAWYIADANPSTKHLAGDRTKPSSKKSSETQGEGESAWAICEV